MDATTPTQTADPAADPARATEDTNPWCPWCERWQAEDAQYAVEHNDFGCDAHLTDPACWCAAWCWGSCDQAGDPEATLLAVQAERDQLREALATRTASDELLQTRLMAMRLDGDLLADRALGHVPEHLITGWRSSAHPEQHLAEGGRP